MTSQPAVYAASAGGSMTRHCVPVLNERHESRQVLLTPFVAGFFFSFRTVIVLIVVRLFQEDPRMGVAISLACDFLLLLIATFQAIGPAVRPLGWLFRLSSFRWVLVFLLFSGCSLAWSGTVSLPASFLYWCGMAADVAIVVSLLRVRSVPGVTHSLMKGFIWGTCVLALTAWIMPSAPDLRLGDQAYFNTNQIGNLCALAIFLTQYLVCRKVGKWKLATLFLIVTLVRSLSKTTLVAFVLSEAFLLIKDRSMNRKTKVALTAAVLLVVLVFWGLFESYYGVYISAGNQAETLTGRTAIWSYTLNAALEKPWIGNGFDSMWKVFPPFGNEQFEARHAENELLQQFFAYGAVGVIVLCGLYGSLCRGINRLRRGPVKLILLSMMLFVVIRGVAEAEPFDLLLPLWAITMLGSLLADSLPSNETVTNLCDPGANISEILRQPAKR